MNREERQLVAFEQLAREVEKLVYLVQESQQNQYEFMQEACRLLQEQHQDVNSLVARSSTQDQLKGMLDEVLKQMNAQFQSQMGAPAGMEAGDVDIQIDLDGGPGAAAGAGAPGEMAGPSGPCGQTGVIPTPAAEPGAVQAPTQAGYVSPNATSGWIQPTEQLLPGVPAAPPDIGTFPFPQGTDFPQTGGVLPQQQGGIAPQAGGMEPDGEYEYVDDVPQGGMITDVSPLPETGGEAVPIPLGQPQGGGSVAEQGVPISEMVEQEAIPVVKPVATPAAGAQIRFFHASPDTPGVDIYIDGKKAAEDVDFEGITEYFPLTAGRHRVQVFPYAKQVGALIDTTFNAKPNQSYTFAIGGSFKDIRQVIIEDEPKRTKPGFARVKIVNLSPNAPAFDVTLPSGKVLIGHLTFKEKSPYLQVSPGRRDLELRIAGKKDVLLRLPKMRFDADVTYTLFVVGLAGGQPPLTTELIPEG